MCFYVGNDIYYLRQFNRDKVHLASKKTGNEI
jgi:hypothetical protein